MLKLILCLLTVLSFATVAYAKDAPQMSVPFPLGRDISDHFVGTVHRNDIIMADDVYKLPQTNVITFEPGSHSGWHVHGAMTIIGLAGTGVYQEWGKPAVLIRQGDVVQIPAGTSHWHGATKNSRFQQIVIYDKDWQAPKDLAAHMGPVTDTEYQHLTFVDAKDRRSEPEKGSEFLFAYPKQVFSSSNFNHPVYLSTVVGQPNEAKPQTGRTSSSPKARITAGTAIRRDRSSLRRTASAIIRSKGRSRRSCIPAMSSTARRALSTGTARRRAANLLISPSAPKTIMRSPGMISP